MGICTSCYTGSSATTTVKLILLDGQLREFRSPVKAFTVAQQPCSFICNADEMDFNQYVTAMSQPDELWPSQLYFELPSSWSKKQLTADNMVSLAIKAGNALMVNDGKVRCGCCINWVDPLMFCDENEMMTSSYGRVGAGGDIGNRRGGGGKRWLVTRLERIVE